MLFCTTTCIHAHTQTYTHEANVHKRSQGKGCCIYTPGMCTEGSSWSIAFVDKARCHMPTKTGQWPGDLRVRAFALFVQLQSSPGRHVGATICPGATTCLNTWPAARSFLAVQMQMHHAAAKHTLTHAHTHTLTNVLRLQVQGCMEGWAAMGQGGVQIF